MHLERCGTGISTAERNKAMHVCDTGELCAGKQRNKNMAFSIWKLEKLANAL